MRMFLFLFAFISLSCNDKQVKPIIDTRESKTCLEDQPNPHQTIGALLLSRFSSIEEFKEIVTIEYNTGPSSAQKGIFEKPEVRLTHTFGQEQVTSILTTGIL
jgi:hypothetical protein